MPGSKVNGMSRRARTTHLKAPGDPRTTQTIPGEPSENGQGPASENCCSAEISSDNGVTIEQIADLVGHKTTIVTQKVYRHQLKPVISNGATAMNAIFTRKSA
jgi:hypothetical protein